MMMAEGVDGVGRSRGRKQRGTQGTPTAQGGGEGGEEELPTSSHAWGESHTRESHARESHAGVAGARRPSGTSRL